MLATVLAEVIVGQAPPLVLARVGDHLLELGAPGLVLVYESGAMPLVVLSKADLVDATDEAQRAVEAVAPGLESIVTSTMTGHGIDELRTHAAAGQTVALIGASGAGKSTLVNALVGNDVQALRDSCKPELALYIGGMGARGKNYYNDYAIRLGYEEQAGKIQDLYLDGKKDAAAALVPDAMVDELALIGPPERIRDRLGAWKQAARDHKVGTMILTGANREALRVVAEAVQ